MNNYHANTEYLKNLIHSIAESDFNQYSLSLQNTQIVIKEKPRSFLGKSYVRVDQLNPAMKKLIRMVTCMMSFAVSRMF